MAIKNIISSKIKTKNFSFQLNDELSTSLFVQSLEYLPFVYISKLYDEDNHPDNDKEPIDGTTIDPRDIIYVKLYNNSFLPEIEIYCDDSKGILFNDLFPFDHDTIINIFVKSNSELLMPIRMDFRVTNYETIKSDENRDIYKYLIKGILNIDDLHYTRYESRKDTSYNVIKDLAIQMDLGFSSNIDNSDDKMTWINPSNTYLNWIQDITDYAWVSEDSFIWTFIDFLYNINYVDIQKELNESNSNEEAPFSNKMINKDLEDNIYLYLTNNTAFKMTNIYINKFNLINQSFNINLEKSYKMKTTWYNKNNNIIYKKFIKEFSTNEKNNQLKNLYDENSAIYCENINDEYFSGKLDLDNVHENYFLAKETNKYSLLDLEKVKMVVTLNQVNFSIKRFQTIKIEIYNTQDLFSSDANIKKPLDNLNVRLSGFWLVTGINYLYKRSIGIEQEIILMRRDLNLTYGKGTDKHDLRNQYVKT